MATCGLNFQEWWQTRFGDLPPLGYILRQELQERWFRIHSLPESKRYPETAWEYEELLHRHNTVATELLGNGALCWLVAITYLFEADYYAVGELDLPGLGAQPLEVAYTFENPADPCIKNDERVLAACWVAEVTWAPGRFDELIRAVADDKMSQVLFVEKSRARIYAPYDGGADLILESTEQRDRFHTRYAAWLSKHPKGL